MEWPGGHEASGRRASRKKINNFSLRPDCNPEPRSMGQNALTVLGLQAHYAGGQILRSHRSDVHSNMPPGFEGFGLLSGNHMRIDENHEHRVKEPLLESDHLENESKMKKLEQRLDSVTQPPSESHLSSDKNHENGSRPREPFLESSCLGNQENMTKLKHGLDSITQPLHTTALQTASGSRPVTQRSSTVVHGCADWLEQKSRTNSGGKRPHREDEHSKGSDVPLMDSKPTTSSASSLECIPIGVPYTRVQSPFTSSPSSPQSQRIRSIPQTTIPPTFPSESHVTAGENHEDRWREPFPESGSSGNKNKRKRLTHNQDSITQTLCTKSALQVAAGSRSVRKSSSDTDDGGCAPQEQISGTDHGGKRLCKEERYDEDLGVAPMNSEHTASPASADSSSEQFPSIFPYTCVQNPHTFSLPQPIFSAPQPTTPPMLLPSNHQPRDIPSGSSSRRLTSAACNKPLIFPDATGFYPNPTEVVHCISSIIQQKFDGPWPTWKKIPKTARDQWFEEFQKRYDWKPEHACQVRSNFEARGMTRLRNFFCVARKNLNVRPHWLNSEVWEGLKQYWDSPEFKLQSEQAKINRASDCDGLGPSKHTCGSIPMSEHKRRLEEKTGEEVTPIKLFVHTHQRKDKTWIDTKSSQAYEKFMKESNKLDSSLPTVQLSGIEGEGQTSAQPTESQARNPELAETELFIKTNLTKRGGIYGIASEVFKYKSFGSSSYASKAIDRTTPHWFDSPEFQQFMHNKVAEINSEWNARFEQERRDTEELRKRVAELEREKREKMKKKKAKKKLNKMKEMMEMLQKQYDSLSKGQTDSDDDDDDDVEDDGSTDSGY